MYLFNAKSCKMVVTTCLDLFYAKNVKNLRLEYVFTNIKTGAMVSISIFKNRIMINRILA